MKRFLISLALSLASTAAFAQVPEHDVLVTPEGTVYTVDTAMASSVSTISAISILDMGVQNGSEVRHMVIPASASAGFHSGATLAYDADSKTLFVLWIHMPANRTSSELLLASYRDGKWQPPVSIDNETYTGRFNLRLGVTRRVSQLQKDGSYADAPALLLHALWWVDSIKGEEARYALLPVENGAVAEASIEVHRLEEFVATDEAFNAVDPKFNAEILRHPAIVTSPMQSAVGVVFGDIKKNTIHNVTLRPIADTRIHIPVGIGGGKPEPHIIAPLNFNADWKGGITVISRGDRLVFANAGPKALSYITYANGAWSDVKSIATDAKFPAEAAIAAVDKMVSTQ